MTETTIAPLEKVELNRNDIESSMKIGKQVILTNVKKRIEALKGQIRASKGERMKVFEGQKKSLTKHFSSKIKLAIKNDSDLDDLRRAVNKLFDFSYKNNLEFVADIDVDGAVVNLVKNDKFYSIHETRRLFQSYVNNEEISIDFLLPIGAEDLKADYNAGDDLDAATMEMAVPLTADMLRGCETILEHLEKEVALHDEIDSLNNKLRNIDKTMEEVEASILLEEMKTTEHGKRALEVTINVVEHVLGKGNIGMLEKLTDEPAA